MSRKKLILSILLMAVLVSAGIILPATHRHQTEPPQDKKRTLPQINKSAEKPPVKTSSPTEIQYLGFEYLETFFPAAQIEELKEQLSSYLQEADYADISSVTFLVDETAYPSNGEVLLSFALSDGGKLPVTCQTASGTFTCLTALKASAFLELYGEFLKARKILEPDCPCRALSDIQIKDCYDWQ